MATTRNRPTEIPAMEEQIVSKRRKWLRRSLWALLAAVGVTASVFAPSVIPASATAPPSEGVVCNNGPSFVLTTRTGYISTPDGNSIYMWGYGLGNNGFQYVGPTLCVNEGDTVTITLKNTLPVPSSIMIPGITGMKVNGDFPKLDIASDSLTTPAPAATAAGVLGTATYTFQASKPGTFLYESGTNPQLQVLMGMEGALIVRPMHVPNPVAGVSYVYNDTSTGFLPNREFMHMFTEIDPHMHHAVEVQMMASPVALPVTYDMKLYKPRYWMINGRSFPDDITPNFSAAIPTQPYGAMVHVYPKTYDKYPAVVRFLNGGPVDYPFHPHSNHESMIGVDGRLLANPTGGQGGTQAITSIDRFGFDVAPGQTAEGLFNWVDAQKWNPDTNPIGVQIPGENNRTDGPYWSGSPYLGIKLPLINGETQWNQCGEYYQFAHSHALFQVTNYGVSGGGMLTFIRVDPPPDIQAKYNVNCNGGPGN